MNLEELGYSRELANYSSEHGLDAFNPGRVIAEHKERYIIKTAQGEFEGEILGNLRYAAQGRSDFPAVGDWVAVSEYDEDKVLIHAIYPRKNTLERQAVGSQGDKQIIASNIDYALIVQAVGQNFNLNRIERYLTLCHTSRVKPIIILNKTDLLPETEVAELQSAIETRVKDIPVLPFSNISQAGKDLLQEMLQKGKTYCLLGSSGVGKSTLINNLTGQQLMQTSTVSTSSNKGKHKTSHRELIVLNNGAIIIDNPGMREVGITDSSKGLEATFELIASLAENCRFKDCTHTNEKACAVLMALENGELEKGAYENYLRMTREKEHFESTLAEKRKKDKDFGKMVRNVKKLKGNKR